jgi:hypothetical protein
MELMLPPRLQEEEIGWEILDPKSEGFKAVEGFTYLRCTPTAAVLAMQRPYLLNTPVLVNLQDATEILKLGHRRASAAGGVRRR